MTNVVDVQNLSKKFGNLAAVDNVSFTVEENRIYGLLGGNGAGKTTLMQLLAGLGLPELRQHQRLRRLPRRERRRSSQHLFHDSFTNVG
ncbi:ATP-binding cassette domain-containing protein [Glaciihabitans sp. UYNi722]|uniref:ATP-binding cassette domain-containing protein n=1 Tax=Glaciihabitans sp. UYNi722 TaxID=3156344 RepID=UPI00339250FE